MGMVKKCDCCGALVEIEDNDPDLILEPFPRVDCPYCGWWIPIFDDDKGAAL